MPIDTNFKVKKSEGVSYDPIPENTYQVHITDIKQVERETKYGIKQKLQFSCSVVDDEQYKGRLVFVTVNISWFNGEGGVRSSALFNLIKTIYSHYKPDVDVSKLDGLNGEMINDLIGKQFIAIVKVNDKYNNVTDFMRIKKEIPYEPKQAQAKVNENVNPDDIPF